jgi:hypothetical protein
MKHAAAKLWVVLAFVLASLGFAQAIPGMAAVDAYSNLKNVGFICEGPSDMNGEGFWECKDTNVSYDFDVEIWGEPTKVRVVEATALNFTGADNTVAIIAPFLSWLATLPYRGAEPAVAKQWVLENLNNHEASTVIGGVTFTIFANAEAARILLIEAK